MSKNAVNRYIKKTCLRLELLFNRTTEPELVEKIESVPNKNGYIKNLIRKDIEKEPPSR